MKLTIITLFLAVAASAESLAALKGSTKSADCALPCVAQSINKMKCAKNKGLVDVVCDNIVSITIESANCLKKCKLNDKAQETAQRVATAFCEKRKKGKGLL